MQLLLADHPTRDDLKVYLERLQKVGQPEVRLVTRGGVMAVYGCTQAPAGLTDTVPVVLCMRAFALRHGGTGQEGTAADAGTGAGPGAGAGAWDVDVTVSGRALLDRIARMGIIGLTLDLPDATVTTAWAGVLPPTTGWEQTGVLDAPSLGRAAEEGIARVADLLPESPGEAVVRQVRASVWGVDIAPGVPAAAAFAAESLGFLREETRASLWRTLTWVRLSTGRGHVLVRSFLG